MIKDPKCEKCALPVGLELEGYLKWYCRKCRHVNILRSFDYKSHKAMVVEQSVI